LKGFSFFRLDGRMISHCILDLYRENVAFLECDNACFHFILLVGKEQSSKRIPPFFYSECRGIPATFKGCKFAIFVFNTEYLYNFIKFLKNSWNLEAIALPNVKKMAGESFKKQPRLKAQDFTRINNSCIFLPNSSTQKLLKYNFFLWFFCYSLSLKKDISHVYNISSYRDIKDHILQWLNYDCPSIIIEVSYCINCPSIILHS